MKPGSGLARGMRPSFGLLGRILAVLLLTVVIEFAASTLLYERANQFMVREDEARRLAEHLVIARKLVSEQPWRSRPATAKQVSTNRYEIHWSASSATLPPMAPSMASMRNQVVAWEPTLEKSDLHLRLASLGHRRVVAGELKLADGSWLHFSTAGVIEGWSLAFGRIFIALVPAVGLIVVGGLLVRRLLNPLRMLARAAAQIGRTPVADLPETGSREVRRVVRAFNDMQARIHRLIADHTQALAAVGHDFRTPLARMQLRADQIDDATLRRAFEGDITELEAMVASLLAYLGGEREPEPPGQIDIAVLMATLVDDVVDRGRQGSYTGPDHLEIIVRPLGLKRALANLVDNALHYGNDVFLSVLVEDDAVTLRVEDDGPGIPEADLEKVVEPFTRLDAARSRSTLGLGLGLAIVVRAVEIEGGIFRLSNRAGGGLCADIRLPLRAAQHFVT